MLLVAAPELHSASTRTPGAFQSIELAFLPRPGGAFQEDYTNPMRCMCSPNSSLSKTALADAGSTVWPARKWLHRRTLWWPASERWLNILVVSTGRWPKLQQSCCEISPWAPAFAKRFPSSASTPPRDPLELASLQKIGSHIFTPAVVWVCPEMPYKPKFQFHRGNDETHEILGTHCSGQTILQFVQWLRILRVSPLPLSHSAMRAGSSWRHPQLAGPQRTKGFGRTLYN